MALLLLFPLTGGAATIEKEREQFFGQEKLTLRIEFKSIFEVVPLIHPLFSEQGWYRIQPIKKTLEICDSPEKLDKIQEIVQLFDVGPKTLKFTFTLLKYTSPPLLKADSTGQIQNQGLKKARPQSLFEW